MEFEIPLPEPFHLSLNLRDITRQPFGLTEKWEKDCYTTLILHQPVKIFQGKKNENLRVVADNTFPHIKKSLTKEIAQRFGLNQDLLSFYQFARKDKFLAPLTKRLEGLTLFQKSSPFEALITAIIDQQLNVSFATHLKRRLILRYGSQFKFGDELIYTFPVPEKMANLSEKELRVLQFSRQKIRYMIELSRGVEEKRFPLESWRKLKDKELIEQLMSIYGVGQWTAEYAAMIGYGRTDVVPAADIGLQKSVQNCYGLKNRPSEAKVRKIAENWRPWRSLVTYYLWHGFE